MDKKALKIGADVAVGMICGATMHVIMHFSEIIFLIVVAIALVFLIIMIKKGVVLLNFKKVEQDNIKGQFVLTLHGIIPLLIGTAIGYFTKSMFLL